MDIAALIDKNPVRLYNVCVSMIYRSVSLQVEKHPWGTRWRCSSETVITHVDPAAPPVVPAWRCLSADGNYMICLR